MAESFTSYELKNDAAFKRALDRAKEVVSDLRTPFGLIGKDFYRSQKAIFGLKGPGQYPPFKNSVRASSLGGGTGLGSKRGSTVDISKSPYQRAKLRDVGFDYPLLVRTGRLSNSLLGPSNAGSVFFNQKQSLVIGTTIDYGIYHQSDKTRSTMPLRKFLFIGPEAPQFATSDQKGRPERWLNYINDYVIRTLKKEGLKNG